MPSKRKGGFQRKVPSEQCLTKEQTKQIYDKIETGAEVRIRKLVWQGTSNAPKQEMICK